MSDSVSATSILNLLSWARTMKPVELDEVELEAPAPVPPPAADVGDEAEEEEEEDEPVVSPTAPLSCATVPATGARRFVASSAFWALDTLSLALSTLASAAA
jgi:hypothetical protein